MKSAPSWIASANIGRVEEISKPVWWCLTCIWQKQLPFIAAGYKIREICSSLVLERQTDRQTENDFKKDNIFSLCFKWARILSHPQRPLRFSHDHLMHNLSNFSKIPSCSKKVYTHQHKYMHEIPGRQVTILEKWSSVLILILIKNFLHFKGLLLWLGYFWGWEVF